MGRSGLGMLLACLAWALGAGTVRAQQCGIQTPTFSDTTFNNADWELMVFTLGTGGAATAGQLTGDGNPAPSRFIDVTVNPGGTAQNPAIVYSFSGNRRAIWTPTASGSIASVDFCEDAKAQGVNSIQGTGLALKQNGKVFVSLPGLVFTPHQPSSGWTAIVHPQLRAGDFYEVAGTTVLFGTGHPDFSTTGGPIEFGYYRQNSGANGYTSRGSIDNWRVAVNVESESRQQWMTRTR